MSVQETADLAYSVDAGIASVLLNRPTKRNALSRAMIRALKEALATAEGDPAVRVVTLAGAGADFSSGMDLGELRAMAGATVAEQLADVDALGDLFVLLRRVGKPVVALVRGRALAGGCGLAIACDLVLAAESASFGFPEVHIGFVPAMVTAILRRNVGEKRAFELIANGDTVPAAEAERIGLINRVFPDDHFDERAGAYVAALASRGPLALRLCKRVLYQQDGLSFEAAVRAGADVNVISRTSGELARGLEGFLAAKPAG